MNKNFTDSKTTGISCMQYKEGKLTGLVICCVGNCLLKRVNEEKTEERIGVTGRQGRRRKQLLDDVKARENTVN
jgi:hypothetical protein